MQAVIRPFVARDLFVLYTPDGRRVFTDLRLAERIARIWGIDERRIEHLSAS